MSLTSLLNVARGAMLAHQRAVSVAGHNIANAETPGFSRQRVNLAAATPEPIPPFGQVGRGVDILSIERLRSGFYDENWRRETGVGGQFHIHHRGQRLVGPPDHALRLGRCRCRCRAANLPSGRGARCDRQTAADPADTGWAGMATALGCRSA